MFHPRPTGATLARRVETMIRNPEQGGERFDQDFEVSMRCIHCGKLAYGKRSLMRAAMEEHWNSVCPARHTKADAPKVMQILYPKQ